MIYPRKHFSILLFFILVIALAQSDQQPKPETETPQPTPVDQKPAEVPPTEQIPQPEQAKAEEKIEIPQPVIVDPIKVEPVPIISDEPVLVEDANVIVLNNTKLEGNEKPVDAEVSVPEVNVTSNQTESENVKTDPKQAEEQEQKPQESNYKPNVAAQEHATNTGQAKNINPNNERDEKIKQEQARLEEIRKRQYQEKKAKGKEINTDTQFENDRKLTRSEEIKFRERSEISTVYNQYDLSQPKKTVLFEVNTQIDEFLISPTTDTEIAIKMLLYTLENNAYGFVKDIDVSKALKIYIYENNDRIVAQGEFYYEKAIKFQARAGAHYVIRFYNDGALKLVSFTYPSIIEHSQMSQVLKKEQGRYHLEEIHFLDRRIEEVTSRLRRNTLLDKVNHEVVIGLLSNYSGYQFIEMLFVIAITIFQLQMVKKMFKVDSIL